MRQTRIILNSEFHKATPEGSKNNKREPEMSIIGPLQGL